MKAAVNGGESGAMADGRGDGARLTRRYALAAAGHLLAGAAAVILRPSLVSSAFAQSVRSKGKGAQHQPPPAVIVGSGTDGLPPAVADMRNEILSAVDRGDIAELKRAMDLNELKPEFGAPPGSDPIDFLRSVSADGKGVSILLEIGRLFAGKWAAIPGGRDIENNRIYVWPHFAEVPLAGLDASERAALADFAGETRAAAMEAAGKWRGWRLTIGADGVWHTFMETGAP